jgi:hypothetical protein
LHQKPSAIKLQTQFQAHKSCAESFGMNLNFTYILQAAFSYQSSLRRFYVLTIWVCNFVAKGFWRKCCSYNVGEIDPSWQHWSDICFATFI